MTDRCAEKILIDSWDEVPDFASEADEQAWWETHDFSNGLLAASLRHEREQRAHGGGPPRPADIIAKARQGAVERERRS